MVWYDTRVNPNLYQVWGRIVRYGGGGTPQFLTGDFFIGAPAGGANGELGMDVAYAIASRRFLVAYNQIGPPTADIVAQLVDNGGNLVGGPQPLSLDNHWQREPSVAYDTAQRHLHGGVGRVLQPGRARRRARAHRVGLDRRARPGA